MRTPQLCFLNGDGKTYSDENFLQEDDPDAPGDRRKCCVGSKDKPSFGSIILEAATNNSRDRAKHSGGEFSNRNDVGEL